MLLSATGVIHQPIPRLIAHYFTIFREVHFPFHQTLRKTERHRSPQFNLKRITRALKRQLSLPHSYEMNIFNGSVLRVFPSKVVRGRLRRTLNYVWIEAEGWQL